MRDYVEDIEEDLKLCAGMGVTRHAGADSYPFYIVETLRNGVLGLYSPRAWFKEGWTGGRQEVAKFDPSEKATSFIRKSYGHWWECSRDGHRTRRVGGWLKFGEAVSFLDPTF